MWRLLAAAVLAVPAVAAVPACMTDPEAASLGGDDDPTGGFAVGTPCQDEGDCGDGLYCVATPCENESGDEPPRPGDACGRFTCQLLCASEGHLLCSNAFSCCSGDLECNTRSQCVEPD